MKKVRENKNLIIIFFLIFLTFPIQNFLENKSAVFTLSIATNVVLIFISIYFISNFITKFLRHAEQYNFEISRKDIIAMNSLNNNFRFYITMLVTLVFFGISLMATYSSFQRTELITGRINWWNNREVYKYLNIENANWTLLAIIVLINSFLIYSVVYIFACLFVYSIIKTVATSNDLFVKTIYRKSTKLNNVLKMLFEEMTSNKEEQLLIENSWKETVILINNIESLELRTMKKGNIPPDLFNI
ncbi:hypothetical protein [Spiroplasma endosymbiont of Diplazon laetatorius]|uniref:hypothetical protein n=1 Tax=Spiroplasma endosymbiont of Diplazon laetatorius TaxID=3066322 RepID=UPI0030CBB741